MVFNVHWFLVFFPRYKQDFPTVIIDLYFQGNKELVVSLFQALVLLMFNHMDDISLEEIRAATNIEVSYSKFEHTLLSLERCFRNFCVGRTVNFGGRCSLWRAEEPES